VVIGSGATAVTLVPAMAETAAHVTMLQRSPSYVVSMPSEDRLARLIRRFLPERAAHRALRWRNVLLGIYFYQLCRRAPGLAKKLLRRGLARELPPGFDIDTHFKPKYQPWDQRVCLVPDADLFQAMKGGRVEVVTDQIANFTKHGILLKSGKELPADIVVTATGLNLLACGGIRLSVDGVAVEPGRALTYKGLMLSDVPNCAVCVGYTTASWTLRADLSSAFVCRLINHMDRRGYAQCVPRPSDPDIRPQPLLGLNSGYVQRGISEFPKQGSKTPWVLPQNYIRDLMMMRFGAMEDGSLVFSKRRERVATTSSDETVAAVQAAAAPA
jgi:monooxygenase